MQSISTMPLLTMMPTSMTKPIMETMLISKPATSSASRPPVNASGMVSMTIKGESSDWNCATMMRYTITMPSSSISRRSFMASMMVSFSPENSRRKPSGSA